MLRPPCASATVGVYLARHGQTAYNHEGRFQGQLPVPLDEQGRDAGRGAGRARGRARVRGAVVQPAAARARNGRDRRRQDRAGAARGRAADGDGRRRLDGPDVRRCPGRSARAVRQVHRRRPHLRVPRRRVLRRSRRCASSAALDEVEQARLPALVVCHGMVIRAALSVRAGHWLPGGQRVANGALVPLDPGACRAPTSAAKARRRRANRRVSSAARLDELGTFAGHARAGDDQIEAGVLGPLARLRVDVRVKAERRGELSAPSPARASTIPAPSSSASVRSTTSTSAAGLSASRAVPAAAPRLRSARPRCPPPLRSPWMREPNSRSAVSASTRAIVYSARRR